jgi:3-oxoadipate enol-lactonase
MDRDVRDLALLGLLRDLLGLRRLAAVVDRPLRVALDADRTASPEKPGDRASLPLALRNILAAASRAYGISKLALEWDDEAPLTAPERIVAARLRLADRLKDAHTLEAIGSSSAAELEQRIAEIGEEAPERRFSREIIRAADGAQLDAYEGRSSGRTATIFVNACGMPIELIVDLMLRVQPFGRVVTWETRSVLRPEEGFDGLDSSADAQVGDMLTTMQHYGIERAHVVAVCVGALVAVRFAARYPERTESLCILNGSFALGTGYPATDHEVYVAKMWASITRGRRRAARYHHMFCGPGGSAAFASPYAHLILLPYANPEILFRYATLLQALEVLGPRILEVVESIQSRTLVIASELDEFAHPEAARVVTEHVPNVEYYLRRGHDHLSLFTRQLELTEIWKPFMQGRSALGAR